MPYVYICQAESWNHFSLSQSGLTYFYFLFSLNKYMWMAWAVLLSSFISMPYTSSIISFLFFEFSSIYTQLTARVWVSDFYLLSFNSEENIYLLCKKLCTIEVADPTGDDLFVVFISNKEKKVYLFHLCQPFPTTFQ